MTPDRGSTPPRSGRRGTIDVERTDTTDTPATRRRRPWLGIACAHALAAIATGWWWRAEDPFNPYRDGTTHAATLVNADHMCRDNWGTSLPGYYWQAKSPVPDEWFPGPVEGKVHIVRQRSGDPRGGRMFSAVFSARGTTIDLVGGRFPAFNDLTCSIR